MHPMRIIQSPTLLLQALPAPQQCSFSFGAAAVLFIINTVF